MNSKKCLGFSIVEIMIVLVILVLLAGIAVPGYIQGKAEHKKTLEIVTEMKSDRPVVALRDGWFYTKTSDLTSIKNPLIVIHAGKNNPALQTYQYLHTLSIYGGITNGHYFMFEHSPF